MSNEDRELKAIATVLKEIEELPEERKMPVLKYVIERLKIKEKLPIQINSDDNNSETSSDSKKKLSIQEFMEERNPKNNYQKIACLAYYMDRYEGTSEFGTKEINDAYARAKMPAETNTARDIQNAQYQYSFIRPGVKDKRKKRLTGYGEKIVEALPDRKKVGEIIKGIRGGMKKKSSKSEKAKDNV